MVNHFVKCKLHFNKFCENQYKIIHRLHATQALQSKYDTMCLLLCQKCKNSCGTNSHLIWSCPKLINFWQLVQSEITEIAGTDAALNLYNFVLGFESSYERMYRYILRIAVYAASLTILK